MTTMKAAIYSGLRQIGVRDVERLPPPPGYVFIQTKQVGICGSDLHAYFGEWEQSHTLALGHETCGVVAALGEGVTGLQVGDTVVIECFSHCGQCVYCQTGQYTHCLQRKWVSENTHGGFAEYTTAHVSGLFKLPPTMSYEEGAMVEPLAVAVRTVAQSRSTHQDRVAVIGGGTIGQLCLAVAQSQRCQSDADHRQISAAGATGKDLGADHVININDRDVRTFVKELTNGLGMDVVIETVGGATQFDDAMSIVRKRGSVVLVGGYFKPLEVDLSKIVWSEAIVTGSNCYGYSGLHNDFQTAIDLIAERKVDATKLVTHRFSLDQIAEAFAISADKYSGAIKVHVTP